ncbi:MAG: PA2169 family four-helix-bundle protein [Bacteroidia bacterium]
MKTVSEKTTEALSDLVIINNDRYEGYQKAMELTKDSDLKSLFSKLSSQSKTYSSELRTLIPFKDDAPKRDETRTSGKFYRAWMDVKTALASNDRKAVLNSCEYGEDVAKKTYEDTLKDSENIPSNVLTCIKKQHSEIIHAHDTIKSLRDAEKAKSN